MNPAARKNVKVPCGTCDNEAHRTIEELSKEYTINILRFHGGNMTRTAKALGITRRSLQNWVHRWDIDLPGIRRDASGPASAL